MSLICGGLTRLWPKVRKIHCKRVIALPDFVSGLTRTFLKKKKSIQLLARVTIKN